MNRGGASEVWSELDLEEALLGDRGAIDDSCAASCNWVRATDADVRRDNMVLTYRAVLALPVGSEVQDRYNGRLWRLRVVSRDTDPTTRFAKDVRGWICRPLAQKDFRLAAWGGTPPRCPSLGRLPQSLDFATALGPPNYGVYTSPPFAMEEWNLGVRVVPRYLNLHNKIHTIRLRLDGSPKGECVKNVWSPTFQPDFRCWWGAEPGTHTVQLSIESESPSDFLGGHMGIFETRIRPDPAAPIDSIRARPNLRRA